MKKQILFLVLLFTTLSTIAQTTTTTASDKKESKVAFLVNSSLGFSQLKQDGNVTVNGSMTGADLLLNYNIAKQWSLASGVGLYEFNANTTIAGNNINIRNSYLRIPVQVNGNFGLFKSDTVENQKIFFVLGLGLYANTLLKQEIESTGGTNTERNRGWNFGISSQAGAKFILTDDLSLGLGLQSQNDLTKMKKDGVSQKLTQTNAFYFSLGFNF
jgi:hypothetical protein